MIIIIIYINFKRLSDYLFLDAILFGCVVANECENDDER